MRELTWFGIFDGRARKSQGNDKKTHARPPPIPAMALATTSAPAWFRLWPGCRSLPGNYRSGLQVAAAAGHGIGVRGCHTLV